MGKSMLAANIIEYLCHSERTKHYLVLYFFVDRRANDRERTDPVAILRSLVYQLANSPHLPNNHLVSQAVKKSGQIRASGFKSLWQLFSALLCLPSGRTTCILVDGFDEAPENGILINKLLELVSMPDRDIKLFLTSRTTIATDVYELLGSCSSIKVTARKTRKDMELYISSERTRQVLRKCGLTPQELDSCISELIASANGMYLTLLGWISDVPGFYVSSYSELTSTVTTTRIVMWFEDFYNQPYLCPTNTIGFLAELRN